MKKLGTIFHENEKKNIIIYEVKNGYFYITFENSNKIIEWFINKSSAKKYCENNYDSFEISD